MKFCFYIYFFYVADSIMDDEMFLDLICAVVNYQDENEEDGSVPPASENIAEGIFLFFYSALWHNT